MTHQIIGELRHRAEILSGIFVHAFFPYGERLYRDVEELEVGFHLGQSSVEVPRRFHARVTAMREDDILHGVEN